MLSFFHSSDVSLFRAINWHYQRAWLDLIMPILSDKWPWVVAAAAAGCVLFWWRGGRERRVLWVCILTLIVGDAAGAVIKKHVGRPRPCHTVAVRLLETGCTGSPSFPSNHVLNVAAQAGVLASRLSALAVPLALATLAEAYSRVYVGAHYPSDALGGGLIGLGIGLAIARIFGLGRAASPKRGSP